MVQYEGTVLDTSSVIPELTTRTGSTSRRNSSGASAFPSIYSPPQIPADRDADGR